MSDGPAIVPPCRARWIILACAPRRDRAAIAGDLAERFDRQVRELGARRALRWYASQAVRSLLPLAFASFGDTSLRRWIAGAVAGVLASSFAPAVIHLARDPGRLAGEAPWLLLAISAAIAGGMLAARRPLRHD